MRILFCYLSLSLFLSLLSSCSPINSVEPFDQQQARLLTREIYGIPARAYKKIPLKQNKEAQD